MGVTKEVDRTKQLCTFTFNVQEIVIASFSVNKSTPKSIAVRGGFMQGGRRWLDGGLSAVQKHVDEDGEPSTPRAQSESFYKWLSPKAKAR